MTEVKPMEVQPVTSDPPLAQHHTTVVMMQQEKQQHKPLRNWSTGLFGCFEDCNTFCMGWFCPWVLAYSVANQLGESCFVPLCVPGGGIAMRTKLRVLNNIEGSICCDCCAYYLCCQLTWCQMNRELRHTGMVITRQ